MGRPMRVSTRCLLLSGRSDAGILGYGTSTGRGHKIVTIVSALILTQAMGKDSSTADEGRKGFWAGS